MRGTQCTPLCKGGLECCSYVTFKSTYEKDRTLGTPHLNEGCTLGRTLAPGTAWARAPGEAWKRGSRSEARTGLRIPRCTSPHTRSTPRPSCTWSTRRPTTKKQGRNGREETETLGREERSAPGPREERKRGREGGGPEGRGRGQQRRRKPKSRNQNLHVRLLSAVPKTSSVRRAASCLVCPRALGPPR